MPNPKRLLDPGKIAQNAYSYQAQDWRTSEAGLYWKPMAMDLASAQPVPQQQSVMFFNSDVSVHYVTFGTTAAMTAPSSPLTGIPVPPGQLLILSSGVGNFFAKSDSALVFGYTLPPDPLATNVQIDINPNPQPTYSSGSP